MSSLPNTLAMGAVMLRVANLESVLRFYTEGVGLQVLSSSKHGYVLGFGSVESLVLEQAPELKHASSNAAGLFHTAFLFPTQRDLAFAVAAVASKFPASFTGSADHLVSEAFYFNDPEGNGVELYFDRPRDTWSYANGQIQMDTLALDPNRYLNDHLVDGLFGASQIGHVHLSVGNIEQAREFYVDLLGFDLTFNWSNTALFVSAGGYHHHMAMNIWRSRGAGRRQQVLGLGDVSLKLGDPQELLAVADRAKFRNWQVIEGEQTLSLEDPWGNQITIQA